MSDFFLVSAETDRFGGNAASGLFANTRGFRGRSNQRVEREKKAVIE